MAFRKKKGEILKFKPDILVVPECEKIGEQTSKSLWFGDNAKKGVGIFSYSGYSFELHPMYDASFRYVIPIKVRGLSNFNLFAVWTMKGENPAKEYIGQLRLALDYYSNILDEPTVLMGDFNMDKNIEEKYNYTFPVGIITVRDFLKQKGIESTYHRYYKEEFGSETRPTFFLWKKSDKRFHNDYCFASKALLEKLKDVTIGELKDWKLYSDHMPVMVIFGDN